MRLSGEGFGATLKYALRLPGAFAGLVLEVVRTVNVTVTIHVVVVMGAVAVMVMVLPSGVIIVAAIAVRPTWMGTNWDS